MRNSSALCLVRLALHKYSADQSCRWCVNWRWIARHVPLLPRLPPFLPGSLTGKLSLLTTQASTQLQKCAKPLQSLQLASKQAPKQAHAVGRLWCSFHGFEHAGSVSAYVSVPSCRLVIAYPANCEGLICGSPSPSPLPFSLPLLPSCFPNSPQ